jgi:hypothetical protein
MGADPISFNQRVVGSIPTALTKLKPQQNQASPSDQHIEKSDRFSY